MTDTKKIIVALDFPTREAFDATASALDPELCRVKVGKELFTRFGPAILEPLLARGFDVFLDLKFHDIPNTVAGACRAAADLGVWMINVHASGGRRMLEAARDAVAASSQPPLLIAVSILTSLSDEELAEVGIAGPGAAAVERLARLAADAGLDGLVCSPKEIQQVRTATGADFKLVTPGVRPAGADLQDQRRVMTPADAIAAGADYLVIGRPITQAADPGAALRDIQAGLAG